MPLVQELVRLGNEVQPGLGEWAHWGATCQVYFYQNSASSRLIPVILFAQDVTDTATVLQLRDTCKLVANSVDGIIKVLQHLSLTYIDTPMAGRSVLQHAVPITFGFKMARLLATFQRHKQRLAEILPRLLVLEFGGAVGTLAAIADTGVAFQVQEDVAKELGLSAPDIAWHTERDRIAEVGGFFSLVTATCAKFALDMKLMMQTEVAEVAEGYAPNKGSSSTMPHIVEESYPTLNRANINIMLG
jgi:3-carboxy-cis,cis-muconate cycloisomerase